MQIIKTASWFTAMPPGHRIVGISRGTPRGFAPGYRRFNPLQPGRWYRAVEPREFLRLYGQILNALDPQRVVHEISERAGDGIVPVLVCYESPASIQCGETWCHRHIVAAWLRDRLGLVVEEVDHPTMNPWRKLELAGIEPPTFKSRYG